MLMQLVKEPHLGIPYLEAYLIQMSVCRWGNGVQWFREFDVNYIVNLLFT